MSTSEERFGREHVVSGAFVFLLLGIFAVFATAMVLFSAQLYRGTVADAEAHNDHRVAEGYVMNQLRRMELTGEVGVQQVDGTDVLAISQPGYVYYLYCRDGMMCELYLWEGDPIRLSKGEPICELEAFRPSIDDGLLTMELLHADGSEVTLATALRCESGEEVALP